MNEIRVSEHFMLKEFECPCCRRVMLSERLLERLEELRKRWGRPLVITSGYRCTKHNQAVGGVSGSYHTKGMAADVACPPDEQARLISMAKEVGFKGIGMYEKEGFVHLDVRNTDEPVVWLGGKRHGRGC